MADSSPPGDQPRATAKSISDGRAPPSMTYRTISSKPMRKTGRTMTRS